MKRLCLLFLGLAVMLGLSMTAFAQDPQIEYTGGYQSTYGGFGTGLYSGTVNGTSTQFVCDDSTHSIANGDVWNTNVWTLAQVVTAGNGAFAGAPYKTATGDSGNGGSFTVAQAYSAVAYLANLLFTNADPSYLNQIQYAIWQIMDTPGSGPGNNNVNASGLTMADTAYWVNVGKANDTYTNQYIVFYSPDGNLITSGPDTGATAQEFIGTTPEPISMALMGTFLTLAGFGLGRKKLFS